MRSAARSSTSIDPRLLQHQSTASDRDVVYLPSLQNIVSQSRMDSNLSANPDLSHHNEEYRISTFEDAMEGLEGSILARSGFFYDARLRRVECFSCHVRHVFTNREDSSLYRHLATCDFANGNPTGNIPRELPNNRDRTRNSVSTTETAFGQTQRQPNINRPLTQSRGITGNRRERRESESQTLTLLEQQRENRFPCLNPRHRHMRSFRNRLETFGSEWNQAICSPEILADAGLFFVGPNDQTVCWYCGGRLENWTSNDDPFEEHAKWHPGCEYLLRRRGVSFAQRYSVTTTATNGRYDEVREEIVRPTQPLQVLSFPTEVEATIDPRFSRTNLSRTSSRLPSPVRTEANFRNVNHHVLSHTHLSSSQPEFSTPVSMWNSFRYGNMTVGEAMLSPFVQCISEMGFLIEDIQNVVQRGINNVGQAFTSVEAFVEDLLGQVQQPMVGQPAQSIADMVEERPNLGRTAYVLREEEVICHMCNPRHGPSIIVPCQHWEVVCRACRRGYNEYTGR